MPLVPFDTLPDSARLWTFAAAAPLTGAAADALLATVDEHLANWRAHGAPLVCARDWRDDRFLAIAVDEAATDASGCSIDALFHVLQGLEARMGTSLVGSTLVYWRDAHGAVQCADRPAFRARAAAGDIGPETPVFDTTVLTAGAWRRDFEKPARASWHARMVPATNV